MKRQRYAAFAVSTMTISLIIQTAVLLAGILLLSPFSGYAQAPDSAPPIQFTGDAHWEPYQFLNAAGEPAGFSVDLVKALCREMQLACDIQLDPNWTHAQQSVSIGTKDAILGFAQTPERAAAFDFSRPILTLNSVIAVRTDTATIHSVEDLYGMSVAIVRGTPEFRGFRENIRFHAIPVDSEDKGLQKLVDRQVMACISDEWAIRYAAQYHDIDDIKIVGEPRWEKPYVIGVKKGNVPLLEALNAGLDRLEEQGILNQLRTKWFGTEIRYHQFPDWVWWVIVLSIAAVILMGISAGILIAFNRKLREEVHHRTQSLEAANADLQHEIEKRQWTEQQLRRTNRALRVLSECNQVLVRTTEELELLQKICRIIVDIGNYRLAWVGFAEETPEKRVRPVAQAGFEEGYLGTLVITWDETERGCGPTGTAIRTGTPTICQNMLTDPSYAPWRKGAVDRGYASSIALPLQAEGHILGALNLYAAEPDAFDAEEVRLLTELADDLAYGISALRTQAERRRVEAQLRFQAQLLKSVRESVIATDLEGHIIYWGKGAEVLYGYTAEEVMGKLVTLIVVPQDEEEEKARIQQVQEQGAWSGQYLQRRKDGTTFWSDTSIFLALDEHGEPSGMIGIDRDITERKRIQEALRDSEHKYRTLFQSMNESVVLHEVVYDNAGNAVDYRIVEANPAFEQITGVAGTQAVGNLATQVYGTPDAPYLETYARVAATKEPTLFETYFPPMEKHFLISVFSIEPGMFVTVAQDITTLKQAEEQIKASLEEKTLLLREIQHRTRNNMNVILALLNLQAMSSDDEYLFRLFNKIENRIKTMAQAHEKLYESDLTTVNLEEYAIDLAYTALADFQITPDRVALQLDMSPVLISIDNAVPCGLLLNELLTNALTHAFPDHQRGTVSISLHKTEDDQIDLWVKDNGIGLPDDFDYRQASSLGFRLITQIAQYQLRGTLDIQRNQGTAVHVRFKEPYYKKRI
ncbi:transporter substrate-binding domain-containing protein [candidate division KSB3 bacterium]|uniref:histidine kinase n=1 Tax=candidate division KSB3 bacterium TaxID=2044937 RepID=A0A9D5JRV3_9BACT|nr:transporter substrate-binding domain-containing protein [candidate division KSB3 bacterium]MBD3323018.1 transporter substrate-binding domain-containing protein [candidate division KSB3 bacterium]